MGMTEAMTKAGRKRAGLQHGEVELILHLELNSEAIQRFWDKWPELGIDDHDTARAKAISPEVACLIRETAAALESEGLADNLRLRKTNAMHGHWCLFEGSTKEVVLTHEECGCIIGHRRAECLAHPPREEHRGSRA